MTTKTVNRSIQFKAAFTSGLNIGWGVFFINIVYFIFYKHFITNNFSVVVGSPRKPCRYQSIAINCELSVLYVSCPAGYNLIISR